MFNHHVRHDRDAYASRDHVRDRAELASGQRDLWMETARLEQVMHLLRKAMHFVQEQESLRFEIVQRDLGLLCQSMRLRHKRQQRFADRGVPRADVGLRSQVDAKATSNSPASTRRLMTAVTSSTMCNVTSG